MHYYRDEAPADTACDYCDDPAVATFRTQVFTYRTCAGHTCLFEHLADSNLATRIMVATREEEVTNQQWNGELRMILAPIASAAHRFAAVIEEVTEDRMPDMPTWRTFELPAWFTPPLH